MQNDAAAADEAVKIEAQASVSGLSHAKTRGARAPRRKTERMLTNLGLHLRIDPGKASDDERNNGMTRILSQDIRAWPFT